MERLIIGASIGNCVHVAGVLNFLRLAEEHGYKTKFLGPAVSIDYLLDAVAEADPDMVAVSYRLTPETGYNIVARLKDAVLERGLDSYSYIFGGTVPVANKVKELDFFSRIFNGEEEIEEIIAFLEGRDYDEKNIDYGDNLLDRLARKRPYPLIRHHFGLPSMVETIEGIKEIAEAKVLDIISIGPDQNAQEFFFRPEEMDEDEKGAGGVPIRTEEDLRALYEASRRGNFPLLRSYSGTQDLVQMAELLLKTIKNAWCAVPLTWYSILDGRSSRDLVTAIKENQNLMKLHGERDLPVEVNEAHHWSLRDAHDTIAVVMAYLAAYNAKKMGVKTYVAQYMFNTPNASSASMDLAKMFAKKKLIESLEDENFRVLTQVRAGLTSFPVDQYKAKGQLAYASFLGMALKPDIVHVVAYCEADHAAKPEDVIESCRIARQVIDKLIYGAPDFSADPLIKKRRDDLLREGEILLKAIKDMGKALKEDPLSNAENLAKAIKIGLLDAPHLKGNPEAAGRLSTKVINGACYAYDYTRERIITEEERIAKIIEEAKI